MANVVKVACCYGDDVVEGEVELCLEEDDVLYLDVPHHQVSLNIRDLKRAIRMLEME